MIATCFLIHGGEPLQTEEIIASLTHLAAKDGYTKRVVLEVNTSFNWEELLDKCQNLDLFAERTLMELRLHGETVNKQGNAALEQFLQQQDNNICIIIRANKLKSQTLNSPWVKHIQKKGKIHLAKSIYQNMWPAWVAKRLSSAGLTANKETLELIAKCYEGNLPAAAQFISKISTMCAAGPLTIADIKPYIESNTHFSLYELTNAALNKDAERTYTILNNLKTEGIEPILVLWVLTREIRRLSLPSEKLEQLLHMAKTVDEIIKGIQPGNVWENLLSMCLILTGNEIVTTEDLYL